jgi:hypothetical protein
MIQLIMEEIHIPLTVLKILLISMWIVMVRVCILDLLGINRAYNGLFCLMRHNYLPKG